MAATAAKPGYGTGTGYAHHGDYRLTHSGGYYGSVGYKAAKPPSGRAPKAEPLPTLPEAPAVRTGYLQAARTVRNGQKIIVARTPLRSMAYGLIVAVASEEKPKPEPVVPIRPQIARQQQPTMSAKAFTKHMQHLEYLKRVSTGERAKISPETAALAMRAWRSIWQAANGHISVPAACTGPDGEMFYSWDRGRHHLELEIIPGQPAEFFYRDRETERFWGEDYTIGDPLPAEVVAALPLFR